MIEELARERLGTARHLELERQERDRDGEHAVAERFDAAGLALRLRESGRVLHAT